MARISCLLIVAAVVFSNSVKARANQEDERCIQLKPVAGASESPVITALAVDPRGELLAAAGDDHVIRILSADSLTELAKLDLHSDWVRGLDFSTDGRLLVSAGNDGSVLFWERDANWRSVEGLSEGPALNSVCFSPNGEMVAAVGFTPELLLVGVASASRPRLNCGCQDMRAVTFRPDGLVLAAAGRSGDVKIFDAVTGSTVDDVTLHKRRITGLVFLGPSSRILSVSEDGRAVIYDFSTQKVIHEFKPANAKFRSVALVDGTLAAIGGTDNLIRVYDTQSGQLLRTLEGHTGSVAVLAAGKGVLYSGGFDTTLRCWRVENVGPSERVARQPE